MTVSARLIVIAGLFFSITGVPAQGTDFPELEGPYFGQSPPGKTARLFAPGIISKTGRYEFGMAFSPQGDRLLFTVQVPEEAVLLLHSRLKGGRWTEPAPVSLAHGARKDEMEAFFAPDNKHVYFAPYDEGLDVRVWQVEIDGDDWLNPRALAGPIAEEAAFYPTCANDGAIYYLNLVQGKPFVARQNADGTWTGKEAGLAFGGHTFIAPDGAFILLDARHEDSLGKGDIYVAFAQGNDTWSTPVNLGPQINSTYSESCPSLSADGKFIFFSRYDEEGEIAQIYWASAEILDDFRPTAP